MSYCTNNKCINAANVNVTLKNIFKFIVQNQISASGYLNSTTILLNMSLKAVQTPTTSDRESAENRVSGIVTEVTDTYVVILTSSKCENKSSEYIIEYNKIIYLANFIFTSKYDQFKKYLLKKTPTICYEKDNQYIDMIASLDKDLCIYKDDINKDFKVIFAGVNSRVIYNRELEVIRNIVLFEKATVFPITSIDGYIVLPRCITAKDEEQNNTKGNLKGEVGGVLNV